MDNSIAAATNELVEKRKSIKTFDDLIGFLKDIKENYDTGYCETPSAIAQAALAVAWYLSSEFGITGFQASHTMWDFILGFIKIDNKCGLKLIDYDDMLYPQYEYEFEKTINKGVWDDIQKQATINLENCGNAAPSVIKHWESIANGKIPFYYHIG